jgi:hypothetical protein
MQVSIGETAPWVAVNECAILVRQNCAIYVRRLQFRPDFDPSCDALPEYS